MRLSSAVGRRIIWNGDDFGFSGPVNEGIALAHRQGMLRGASLLAGGEAFEGAVRMARLLPGLDLGVHLAAVGTRPVLPAERLPGLCDPHGRLPADFPAFLKRYLLGGIRPQTVELEWEAQIARVRDTGLRPVYLDSHQHLHVLPGLFEATLRLMARFDIRAVRTPGDVIAGRPGPVRRVLLSGLFSLGGRARELARSRGYFTADGTLGVGDAGHFQADTLRSCVRLLGLLRPGTWELVSHPGLGEPAGSPASSWGYQWEEELAAARDEELARALAGAGIRVVGYRDCLP